jgi:hypothetical protein
MTLAAILFLTILSSPAVAGASQSPPAQTAAKPQNSSPQATTGQGNNPQSSTPAPTKSPASPNSQTKKAAARPQTHKKAVVNCNPAPLTSGSSASKPSPGKGTPANPPNSASANAKAPTNCPPTKVIVRQGGSSDPSIELAGGAVGNQASNERRSADDMLAATQENLKKVDETQLTNSQKAEVDQIRQYIEQSKAAAAAGDLDRARTLAWKAQSLSEDLVKPGQ